MFGNGDAQKIIPNTYEEWRVLAPEVKEHNQYLLLYNLERRMQKMESIKFFITTASFFGGIVGGIATCLTYLKHIGT